MQHDGVKQAGVKDKGHKAQPVDGAQGHDTVEFDEVACDEHDRAQAKSMELKERIKRNLKIAAMVLVALVGYMAYNMMGKDEAKDAAAALEELKASLPLSIDSTTVMTRIDDKDAEFIMLLEKEPSAYEGWDEHQKQAALDQFVKNAPMLCKNPLLRHIITSGKKVTVILEATDRSFSRQYSVDKCPTSSESES